VTKNLSHKTVLFRKGESGRGFSMKKEQDLNPNGFKTLPAHHVSGSSPPDFGQPLSLESAKRPHESYGMSRAKYQHLLGDPEVKRWHQNVARGSKITADVYLRRLSSFCNARNISVRELAGMSEQDAAKRALLVFLVTQEQLNGAETQLNLNRQNHVNKQNTATASRAMYNRLIQIA